MWKGIVNKSFSPYEFEAYVSSLTFEPDGWKPKFVVLHNTQNPSLADDPDGFTNQKILNLQSYYRDDQHWSGGPHLFIDDNAIWVFTPLTVPGVHSPSWNAVSWGVEMLGDYDIEPFDDGRGLFVHDNAIAALSVLHRALDIDPRTLRLHHEDPKTTHHCPGKNVIKADVIADLMADIAEHS
ncbi:MAG: hypothetical protein NVS1B13_26920 [Flavisolibacter sp.]